MPKQHHSNVDPVWLGVPRQLALWWVTRGSVLLAIYSAWRAWRLGPANGGGPLTSEGIVMLAFWALAPPMWLLLEYSRWPPSDSVDDTHTRHSHDLARNIWIAYIAVLAVLMGVEWPIRPAVTQAP